MTLTKKLLYAAIAFVFLLALFIQAPTLGKFFSHMPVFMIILIFVSAIFFLILLVYDLIKKTRHCIIPLLSLIVCSLVLWSGMRIVPMQVESAKLKAESINSAFDSYYKENKKFPESLSELSPKYISDVPKSPMGIIKIDYEYTAKSNAADYWLSFDELLKTKNLFVKSREIWLIDY